MEMRDKLQNLLNNLRKVKSRGKDKYMACCPAHDDKSPSLAVTFDREKILIKCWSGCDVESILGAIGMGFDDIFPDHPIYQRSSGKQPTLSSADALRIVKYEAMIIWMYGQDLKNKKTPTDEDHQRFTVAIGRVKDAMEAAGVTL